ncbi:aldo/keto reductase [SCandidatus Aminicenantes bacterium Aminicenantia_JdfR_composite]|nr:aldo/keto reductase [SCandidatus Aminicenantes bacterium Aminicenantia_JdfR_composite]MCP2596675.1 aldo/keto reductase [Candidatus Aminicenantes bacterium AC-335-G13]
MKRREFLKGLGATFIMLKSSNYLRETESQNGDMIKRRLGRTNLMVSVIGYGGGGIVDWRQAQIIREAIKLGVNFIDTAHKYGDGMSERVIGEAIKGLRDKVYIATKTVRREAKGAEMDIKESLARLQVEKIDILQMHGVSSMWDLEFILNEKYGALKKVKEYRALGKIDFIGITGAHSPIDGYWRIDSEKEIRVMAEAIKTGEFDTIMVSYHIEFQNDSIKALLELARQYDVGVICKKPLGAGKLIKKYGVEKLLKFVLSNPNIHTAIPGMRTIEEVREDVSIGLNKKGSSER